MLSSSGIAPDFDFIFTSNNSAQDFNSADSLSCNGCKFYTSDVQDGLTELLNNPNVSSEYLYWELRVRDNDTNGIQGL